MSSNIGVVHGLYGSRLYRHLDITSPNRLDLAPFVLIYALIAILPYTNIYNVIPGLNLSPQAEISETFQNLSSNSNSTESAPSSVLASIDSWSTSSTLYTLLWISAIGCHIFLILLCTWSTRILCLVRYSSTRSLKSATHIALQATPSSYWELAPLQISSGSRGFTYQHRKFLWSSDKNSFLELDFPTCHPRQYYLSSQGLGHEDDAMFIQRVKYGLNAFDVPLPSFQSLFSEHATAPFFVFQMLCVGLWLLDEYWYYSLMTLCMLVLFEMSVVKRRLVSLEQVRNMRAAPYEISVYRSGRWRSISTRDLLPGDILSLKRYPSESGHHVPCDVVLLKGSCVVDESLLTGESVPQLKEPLCNSGMLSDPLDMNGADKSHVLFGGTQIIIHSAPAEGRRPPDAGAVAYVLRTGFHTAQGRLISTMVSSTERVTVNNADAFLFILLLLVFAVTAAAYVLIQSWNDPTRSRSKLLLNCIMIITSVVPPELPMELSLAVNVSLAALMRKRIFCTEPFRIPFAGAVGTVCFDKTGTLTEDKFEFLGVASDKAKSNDTKAVDKPGNPSSKEFMPMEKEVDPSSSASRIIGSCHSLVHLDGKIIGDPLETAAVRSCHWQAVSANSTGINTLRNSASHETIRIVRRFPFDSALRRMACVVVINNKETYAVCKGAPEAIVKLLGNIPAYYESTHRHYSREGRRVLALGYKLLQASVITETAALKIDRQEIESNLTFAGFIILDSPMKSSSSETVRCLKSSSHFVVMITGDHALTACNVSSRLNIVAASVPTYILSNLTINENSKQLTWVPVSDNLSNIPYHTNDVPNNANLCVTGPALHALKTHSERTAVIVRARIFARVNPEQKQLIINILKEQGHVTMMCGDGTNDVGALKHSHVGVALLTGSTLQDPKQKKAKATTATSSNRTASSRQNELLESLDDGPQIVSLGDASVAAPFTAKRSEVDCCLDIIRQGRCTLVTTMQMYQILALQCLVSAYSLSVLYLDGVKLGDTQMTITGILVALMFLFISRAQPLQTLSPERPQTSVFAIEMLISIFGQFAIHLAVLIVSVKWTEPFRLKTKDIDGDFSPNVLNTVVYLISTSMTLATFAANYKGRPFMQSLSENKALWRCISASFVATLCLCLEIVPSINEALELHPFPQGSLQTDLALLMIADFVGSVSFEYVINKIALRRSKVKIN